MVVLTEELHGLSLKRKGGHEAGLFDDVDGGADDRSRFSLSCRATKMRRLACSDDDQQAAVAAAAAWEEEDVAMGEDDAAAEAPSPSPGDDERAVVVYGAEDSGGDSSRRIDAPRLRADWIRAILREADSRTVRELLAGAARLEHRGSEHDLALAVVPWMPAPAAADSAAASEEEEEEEAAAADGEDGAAAMDVEGQEGRPWTWAWTGQGQATQACAYGDAAGEALVYRWPTQHCWAPPAPAVAQASPVMWSW